VGVLGRGKARGVGRKAKVLLEALQSQDTAHDTRVISCIYSVNYQGQTAGESGNQPKSREPR